jgi:SH3 domain-containing protein
MTLRSGGLVVGVMLFVAVAVLIGYVLGQMMSTAEDPTPSPSPSVAASCQVTVTPTTIHVEPESSGSDDVLFIAGAGFPPNSAVQIDFAPAASLQDFTSSDSGTFEATIPASPGSTYEAGVGPGPLTWTVRGWDVAEPGTASPVPEPVCSTEVTVTIALTEAQSPTPPTDLSAGGYAEVLADGVRVRVEPSLESTAVGALFAGDIVRILTPAQEAEGLVWYRIESVVTQAGGIVRGYMAAGADGQVYLRPTGEPPPPTPTPSPSPSPSPS